MVEYGGGDPCKMFTSTSCASVLAEGVIAERKKTIFSFSIFKPLLPPSTLRNKKYVYRHGGAPAAYAVRGV